MIIDFSKHYDSLMQKYIERGAVPERFNLFGIRNDVEPELDKFNDYIGYAIDGKAVS